MGAMQQVRVKFSKPSPLLLIVLGGLVLRLAWLLICDLRRVDEIGKSFLRVEPAGRADHKCVLGQAEYLALLAPLPGGEKPLGRVDSVVNRLHLSRDVAEAVHAMGLKYVVITSVDRDDLRDGGARHFAQCIKHTRQRVPQIKIEILVPDFRGRMDKALEELLVSPPDVFNHNLETVPRLYKKVRPGADYQWSLDLIREFKKRRPDVPTKSGLMLGLGETIAEVQQVLSDLRMHACDRLTLGQYLQPSRAHLPVERFVTPDEFTALGEFARTLGFSNVASGPLVRSSYHADLQAAGERVA